MDSDPTGRIAATEVFLSPPSYLHTPYLCNVLHCAVLCEGEKEVETSTTAIDCSFTYTKYCNPYGKFIVLVKV